MKLIIIILVAFCANSALAGDSSALIKVKYYLTQPTNPFLPIHKSQVELDTFNLIRFINKYSYDSLINVNELQYLDLLLKKSNAFKLCLFDSQLPNLNKNIEFDRVIIFIYNNKTIYFIDKGNWDWDFRLLNSFILNRSNFPFNKRTIRNKHIYINGNQLKNDRHLRKAIKKVQVYLNCGWC